MTNEQVIRVLAEFEGFCTLLEKMHAPDYLNSLDSLRPVERKLSEWSEENYGFGFSDGCYGISWFNSPWYKLYKLIDNTSSFILPSPGRLAHALAEAIVEAGLVKLKDENNDEEKT